MPMPKSVTKIDRKGGVEFISNVDQVNYTMRELSRAALRDTGKYLRKLMIMEMKKMPGMGRSRRVYRSMQYWNRSRSVDLQVGMKHDTWYGVDQELGTNGQPPRSIVRSVTMKNIDQIRQIQAQYLSALSQDTPSLSNTDEGDYESPEGEES